MNIPIWRESLDWPLFFFARNTSSFMKGADIYGTFYSIDIDYGDSVVVCDFHNCDWWKRIHHHILRYHCLRCNSVLYYQVSVKEEKEKIIKMLKEFNKLF